MSPAWVWMCAQPGGSFGILENLGENGHSADDAYGCEAEALADRVGILHEGRLRASERRGLSGNRDGDAGGRISGTDRRGGRVMRTRVFAWRNLVEILRDPLSLGLPAWDFRGGLLLMMSLMRQSIPDMPADVFGLESFTPGMAVLVSPFWGCFWEC